MRKGLSCVVGEIKFTYEMAHRCKEHNSQHGYRYETYYRTDSKDLRATNKGLNVIFEMHIAIQASSNGHILLSPVPNPSHIDDVYEIVVGGGGNRFTELRRNLRRNAKISVKTPNILSTIELRAFYIKISEDGLIEFSKEGDTIPLLSFYDIDPLQIKYFSFAAWTGVEAKFLYDCPVAGDNVTEAPTDSQMVEPKLSSSDDLKRTLLMGRLPSIPPNHNMTVKLRAMVTNVRYNPFESILTTRLAVIMTWTDDSMAWNPNKFNGTTSIKFRQGQLWRPTFFVYNSNNIKAFDTNNPDLITMVNSGEATFHFQTKVKTLCPITDDEIRKWPRDEYQCSIFIQAWEAHEQISLELLPRDDVKVKAYSDVDEMVDSEWEFTMEDVIIEPRIWDLVYESYDNNTHRSDRYIIQFNLKRRASAYDLAFYTPLIALTMFLLMSFWSEPLQMSRVWFYSGCTIVMCMGLCYIDYIIPIYSIPNILILYATVLGGVLLALVVQVALLTSMNDNACESIILKRLITSNFSRTVFCLPTIRASINGGYMVQEDDDSGVMVPPSDNMEEMESEDSKKVSEKTELAMVIDKLMFVAYSITIAAMLLAHY
ncbi:hypothetical protein K1T71_012597 [Dendrolimus kikuchii]|uniref:Uncharacterized protein n=1 Tax=Dendrolimus kikuchii TaxID=765133 RepID=A0ACC1CK83_9NEOP|nr:hypothetical protein K1T71_012597 [Dendrolimus kikuchii]